MSDLRETVARAIAQAAHGGEYPQDLYFDEADAAIKAVLDALPTGEMLQAGNRVWLDGGNERQIFEAMLTAFTRDHYLSELAREDGKEL